MKKLIIIFSLALVLSGCEVTEGEVWITDQTKRQEIFKQCLELLPAGPVSTTYNDWAEVVNACDNAAYYQSRKCVRNCKDTIQ